MSKQRGKGLGHEVKKVEDDDVDEATKKKTLTDGQISEYYTATTDKKGKGKMARWTGEGEAPIKNMGKVACLRKSCLKAGFFIINLLLLCKKIL